MYGLMGDVIAVTNRVDPTFLRKAYRANLRLVLETIENYKDIFKGNVVITSDHGEMLGEYDKKLKTQFYLHSPTFPEWAITKLKDVPWLVWKK
jgi:membrane-anchored protein YejM (alkaline phosphatase superfamily)